MSTSDTGTGTGTRSRHPMRKYTTSAVPPSEPRGGSTNSFDFEQQQQRRHLHSLRIPFSVLIVVVSIFSIPSEYDLADTKVDSLNNVNNNSNTNINNNIQ